MLIESSKATPFLGETLRIAIRHFTTPKVRDEVKRREV
jgi:hypothetical protein